MIQSKKEDWSAILIRSRKNVKRNNQEWIRRISSRVPARRFWNEIKTNKLLTSSSSDRRRPKENGVFIGNNRHANWKTRGYRCRSSNEKFQRFFMKNNMWRSIIDEKNIGVLFKCFTIEEWKTEWLISLDPLCTRKVIAGIFSLIVISEKMIGGLFYHRNSHFIWPTSSIWCKRNIPLFIV